MKTRQRPTSGDDRSEQFRSELAEQHLRPLWDIMGRLVTPEPIAGGAPALWPWEAVRQRVLQAGDLVSAADAERRVLVLENPNFEGEGKITSSLYSGVQLVLPGEIAHSHRHTANALRLILEGGGGYTTVDGERIDMSPGDFIITPSGTFHDHGNDGDTPVIWLDGLDVFIVNQLNASFAERLPDDCQSIRVHSGDSLARYGSGLLPHGYERKGVRPPLFCWPFARTREALRHMGLASQIDRALGMRMNYIDPTTGASPIPTMSASVSLFPAGFNGEPYRATAGTVCCIVEGTGTVEVANARWSVAPKDIFVIPSWSWHRFVAEDELLVFSFSDEVLQRHLGFWREERETTSSDSAP